MRFVFTTWYGAGNQVPAVGLAQQLVARGHDVCFAGYRGQRDHFERRGLGFTVLERSDAAYRVDEPPERVMAALVDGVWATPEHLTDVPELLAREQGDVLVADCMMFAVLAAAESAAAPVAVLVHSAPGALSPPGGPGEALVLGPVNDVRKLAGRPPLGSCWDAWSPHPTLCTSIAELDPLARSAPGSFHYVGPVAERVEPSGWALPWSQDDPRPLVLASFSTGPAWDQRSRLQRTLDACADTDRYRVLALTTATDPRELTVPGNAVLRPYVPHAEVLPHVAVTVTHAGHGTVAASLAHGVPVVALPNPAADQPVLAARVAELGAGIALDGETASTGELATAVDTVLTDPAYPAAARRLGTAIASAPGVAHAADVLERVASGAP